MRAITFIVFLLVATFAFTGCASSGGAVAAENDRLRERALTLENENKTLTSRVAELETQLAQANRAPTAVPADVLANTPHVTAIALSRLSQAMDTDSDGKLDMIALYMEPADGLGRFLQTTGSVSMHAAVLPAEGAAVTIGQGTLGPKELRDGYRSAFTGQYYSLTLPIDAAKIPAGATECTVRVVFTDGYTGQSYSAERVIDLRS